jgi:prepilin-type processing-associated H-X9-DG protein
MMSIVDGTSTTFLIGEKYINSSHYGDGVDPGDDATMYCGGDKELLRWTGINGAVTEIMTDGTINTNLPRQDASTPGSSTTTAQWFGSAHAGSFNMSFCDGSVHSINYSIDGETFRRLGNRQDRLPVDGSQF